MDMGIDGIQNWQNFPYWHLGSSTSFMWGITSLVSIEDLTLDEDEIGE